MKHINITNWQGNITDWTKFNYIYGGLDESIADRVNLRIPGTNLRNYFRKSNNLIHFEDKEGTSQGFTYSYKNGAITISGTARSSGTIFLPYLENAASVTTGIHRLTLFIDTPNSSIKLFVGHYQGDYDEEPTFRGVSCDKTKITVSKNFTVAGTMNMMPYITAVQGTTYNITIRPMITVGDEIPTTYEPYGSMILVENVGKAFIDSNCTFEAGTYRVYVNLSDMVVAPTRTLLVSMNGYTCISGGQTYDPTWDKVVYNGYSTLIYITNKAYISKAEWIEKEGNNPIIYPLAEPKITVFGQVDLGTLEWVARRIGSSTEYRMMTSDLHSVIALSSSDAVPANMSCPRYKTLSANNTYLKNKGISVDGSGSVAVYDENYNQATSAPALKESVNDVILIYEVKDSSNANRLGMIKQSDPAPTAIEDSMSLDELLEPANEER